MGRNPRRPEGALRWNPRGTANQPGLSGVFIGWGSMEFEAEASDLDELAARALAKAVKSSPWFALSLLFHGALLSVFPLIILSEKIHESLGTPVTISFDAKRI